VKNTVDTTLGTTIVEQFIDDAAVYVDGKIGAAGWSASEAEAIERYLAAHLITLRDRRQKRKRRGDLEDEFESSSYLDAAVRLDPSGTIAEDWADKDDAPAFTFSVGAGCAVLRSRERDFRRGTAEGRSRANGRRRGRPRPPHGLDRRCGVAAPRRGGSDHGRRRRLRRRRGRSRAGAWIDRPVARPIPSEGRMKGFVSPKRIAARIAALGKDVPGGVGVGLRAVGESIMTDVKTSLPGRGVPKDTGALQRSGRVTGPLGSDTEPRIRLSFGGSSAPYALRQHETLEYYHDDGEARYLVRGVERFAEDGFAAASEALRNMRELALDGIRKAAER